jgi:hypothetical protein
MAVTDQLARMTSEVNSGSMGSEADLSPEELQHRVTVLKRFRNLLTDQRDRFRAYLEVLDKQKDVIEHGSAEDLLSHVELEEKIVADIFSIQKVINPLEDMYRAIFNPRERADGSAAGNDVPDLKRTLDDLKSEAVVRSTRNKELLSKRMLELRSEIKVLRSNPFAQRRAYSDVNTASLVDIRG